MQRKCGFLVSVGFTDLRVLTPWLCSAGPLPRFEGIVVDTTAPARESGTTSPPPTTAAGAAPIRVPPLNPEDVNKFVSLFEKSDVSRSGIISGMYSVVFWATSSEELAAADHHVIGRRGGEADLRTCKTP
jgi:hypothetical protein